MPSAAPSHSPPQPLAITGGVSLWISLFWTFPTDTAVISYVTSDV